MNPTEIKIKKLKEGYKISIAISGYNISKYCLKNRLSFEEGRIKRLRKLVNDHFQIDVRRRLIEDYIQN